MHGYLSTHSLLTPLPLRISECSVAYCSAGSICLSSANICWNICCPDPGAFFTGDAPVAVPLAAPAWPKSPPRSS